MEKAGQLQEEWQQEEDTENDEVAAVSLQGRRPRHSLAAAAAETNAVSDGSSGYVMLLPSSEPEDGIQEHRQGELQYGLKDNNDVQVYSQEISTENVYYDKDQGTESIYGFSVTENGDGQGSAAEKIPGDDGLVAMIKNFDSQKSQTTPVNHQYKENLKDDRFSGSRPVPSEKSFEGHKTTKTFGDITVGNKSFSDIEVAGDDIEPIKERDKESTELDVERVLETQDTHDLYCPNCNSCITRRVILRKRRCKIQISSEDAKRNRLESVVASELDGISSHATNDPGCNAVDSSLDSGLTPEGDNYHREREPEIFRCLSCFSFFIPTGSGHEVDTEENTVGISKQDVKSPPQSVGAQGNVESTSEPHKSGDGTVLSSIEGPKLVGDIIADVGEKIEDVTKKGTDDKNSILLLSKPVSELEESDINEKEQIMAGLPSENGQDVGAALQTRPLVEDKYVKAKTSGNAYSFGAPAIIGTNVDIHVEEPLKADIDAPSLSIQDNLLLPDRQVDIAKDLKRVPAKSSAGPETIIEVKQEPIEPAASEEAQDIITSSVTGHSPYNDSVEAREFHGLDIIKSIVYGGLVESITSLGIVTSAAAANAATMNILVLGLANLIGGLFIISHNLWELKNEHSRDMPNQVTEGVADQVVTKRDRYEELLGRREKFWLHATTAVLSFLIFGLLPPVIYGFTFRGSDNRDFKLIAVAGASLLCIIILATGKAYIQRPPKAYLKTVMYYVIVGFMAAGVSYAIGDLLKKLLEKLGWFDSGLLLNLPVLETSSAASIGIL